MMVLDVLKSLVFRGARAGGFGKRLAVSEVKDHRLVTWAHAVDCVVAALHAAGPVCAPDDGLGAPPNTEELHRRREKTHQARWEIRRLLNETGGVEMDHAYLVQHDVGRAVVAVKLTTGAVPQPPQINLYWSGSVPPSYSAADPPTPDEIAAGACRAIGWGARVLRNLRDRLDGCVVAPPVWPNDVNETPCEGQP